MHIGFADFIEMGIRAGGEFGWKELQQGKNEGEPPDL